MNAGLEIMTQKLPARLVVKIWPHVRVTVGVSGWILRSRLELMSGVSKTPRSQSVWKHPYCKQLHFETKHISDIFAPLPDGVKIKTSSALAIWGEAQCSSPAGVELYIDGSAMNNGSGWAVVAVAVDWKDNRSFVGCAAGQTEIDKGNENWIGVWNDDNIAAEVSALVAAQVAALVSSIPTVIRSDLQFSRHLVQATQTSTKIGPVVEVIDNLAAWGAHLIWEVRAHQNDPYNELADSLAKWAASTGGSCGHIPLVVPNELALSKDAPCMWLAQIPDSFAVTMPAFTNDSMCVGQVAKIIGGRPNVDSASTLAVGKFDCQVVSFNAQSIREDKQNQKLNRRDAQVTSRLDSQWNDKGATIIGIRESRTPEGRFRSKNFEIFSSGLSIIWLRNMVPLQKTDSQVRG